MKQFQAYSSGHGSVTRDTPRAAATAFFEKNPKARKCNVTEGVIESMSGHEYFVSVHSRGSFSQYDVTKKTLDTLPA